MTIRPIQKIRKLAQRSMFYRWYAEKMLSQQRFRLDNAEYPYTIHPHNYTWTNERSVELSIAGRALEDNKSCRTLEVGNVTKHYFETTHDVVDKYEKADGVFNVDVVDFSPKQKYEFVLAISTLEHVGWDRDRKEPEKILAAVEKLKQLLVPGGKLLITVPIGFNYFLDGFINDDKLGFDKVSFLKRTAACEWKQTDWSAVKDTKYNSPYSNANAIAVGRYTKAA